jgi:glycerol uptake facilitator-like aquaporin
MAYAVGHISGGHFNCAVTVAGAELSYQQAIAIAKRQSAKMFELRAATSLGPSLA